MAAHSQQNLSIIEVVETLSSIADLEFDREIGITQKHEIVLGNEKIAYKTVHWLHKEDASSTVSLVRETFRIILHYLKQFYKKEYSHLTDQQTIEGIKTIMVLVGEAARKLDKYTKIFHQTQNVTDLKEYQQLQEFYRTKIARQADDGIINKWILGLTLGKGKAGQEMSFKSSSKEAETRTNTQHVFFDLETVKKDYDYDLFFIRKENGSHFFSPRLLRNIKLVCDFGYYFGERKELNPLERVAEWMDRICHTCSREILKVVGNRTNQFFREMRKNKDNELVQLLNKGLLALLLSSHAQNLLRYHPIKSCSEYFADFQEFLRAALQNNLYQRWTAHPVKDDNVLAIDLLDLIHTLCRAFYANLKGLEEMKLIVQDLLQEALQLTSREIVEDQPSNRISNRMLSNYQAMLKLLKHHPNGPLLKVINILENDIYHVFDPILQHNIPNQLYDLYAQDKRYTFLRMPAPIYQEIINRAVINPEFIAFLRSYKQSAVPRKHLLINLQDRTSWHEHARCIAIEKLQRLPEVENAIHVITLAINTDFYHQLAPYHQTNHAELFKKQFKELLLDQNTGYFFPANIKQDELSSFIDSAFEAIHRIFFSSKNVLLRESRLNFIEIFYLLLQLKLIEWIDPDTISIISKDTIDIGESYNAALFVFLKLIQDQEWGEADWQHLNFMLYAPSILIRERMMLPDCFNRMVSALKVVDHAREEFGADKFAKIIKEGFFNIIKETILNFQILLPH